MGNRVEASEWRIQKERSRIERQGERKGVEKRDRGEKRGDDE